MAQHDNRTPLPIDTPLNGGGYTLLDAFPLTGGFGIVYRARRNDALGMEVALCGTNKEGVRWDE